MNDFFRPARLLSFVLAATVTFATPALALESVINEQDSRPAVVNEADAPVIVSKEITGTALGLGSVEAVGVNVRENPTMDAEIVTVVAEGQQVVVLSQEGDWYRVSVDGTNGYIYKDYMTVASEGSASLGYGLVNAEAANIRVSPDSESETVACLQGEEVVTITGITDGWYAVELDEGGTGYVRSDLIDPTAEIPAEKIFDYAVIEGTAVNLRTEPDSGAERADVLYSGSLCTLVQQVGDWYEVSYGDTTGYIYAPLASTTNNENDGSTAVETLNESIERQEAEAAAAAQAAAEAARAAQASNPQPSYSYYEPSYETYDSDDDGGYEESYDEPDYDDYYEPSYDSYEEPSYNASGSSDVVSVAMNYLGYAYVWGGTSPAGFDCSGFVQYVYRQCGYYLTRTADTQYYDGYAVSYDSLQAGDLVFFAGTYGSGISHVGIYIGGGQFIHAANSSDGVKISSLSESYYNAHYYGACRVA